MHRPVAALVVALVCAVTIALSPAGAQQSRRDHAAAAWTILPPGENGSLTFDRNTRDQAALYDGLTPLRGNVTAADLRRFFKPAPLGAPVRKPSKRERPRPGVTILRDSFGVAHVTGRTEADVAFGAGWVTAADRGVLLQLLRGPARIAALDVPGLDPFALALSGATFEPSAEAEATLANQLDALRSLGSVGRRISTFADWYAAGVNAWYRAKGVPVAAFTPLDIVACTALIAARFGANGGQEVANSMFLDALESRFGEAEARRVFAPPGSAPDDEAPVTLTRRFPFHRPVDPAPGSVVVDDGSYAGVRLDQPASSAASSAVLVGATRSETGKPLFVAGPQVGYFFPEILAEMELAGAGFATRGAMFPGVPFVIFGRGPDFAWSAASSQADNVDLFVETLCQDDRHVIYRGQCEPMRRFVAGTLKAPGQPERPLAFYETAHGPVLGYATVAGKRVAISRQRSTRGREVLSARALYALNTARVDSAQSFLRTINGVELSLNWFYADNRDIAFFSSGRLPQRAPGVDSALPTVGTGEYDWRAFLSFEEHARAVNPPSGVIVNWNNRPAPEVGAADSNFAYGSVQRVELLRRQLALRNKHTLAGVVGATNAAATQDLRVVEVWPVIRSVLQTGPAPSTRAQAAAALVDDWIAAGGSRLDVDLDGSIDAPGAAVLDTAWPLLEDAVLTPALGPLVTRLEALHRRDNAPSPTGSAYLSGWYGYLDKDLRALLGHAVRTPFSRPYCGAGALDTCRQALWAAIDVAAGRLENAQGPVPSAWRADATRERIQFASGLLPDTMRWTNRPTFQQAMSFSTRRPRK